MYQDPTKIRSHVVKLRFSDEEGRLIQAIVDYTGEQKASLLREMIIERAMEIMEPEGGAYQSAVHGTMRSAAGT